MDTLGSGIGQETLKNIENEKCTLQDLEYGEKSENYGKCETHTVGREIFQETLKKVKNENSTLEDQEYGEKTENHGK